MVSDIFTVVSSGQVPRTDLLITLDFAMRTAKSAAKAKRLTRKEFLTRSLEVLSREGDSELRIDRLVGALGVTKGSFYWHFEDRADFVHSLAEHWAHWTNDRVIQELQDEKGDPRETLTAIHKIVIRNDLARYDLVMRSWATHEPEVARVVEAVDRTRIDFVGRFFQRLGYRGRDLDIRTRLFVVSTSMWSVVNRDEDKDLRLKRLSAVLDILTHPYDLSKVALAG
jgi:AcrR family transcriptional regulator